MGNKQATREAYGKVLVELGKENPNLIVMDADLSGSTKTGEFAKVYPERFFNMGIAEQNIRLSSGNSAFRKGCLRIYFCDVRSRKSF